jgi:hypothetical protein
MCAPIVSIGLKLPLPHFLRCLGRACLTIECMKTPAFIALTLLALSATVHAAPESLGTVSFPVSCAPAVQTQFARGVALLHDFWYGEAHSQFEEIAKSDPACAMAHWGIAMSIYHQIWDRPDDGTMSRGWEEMRAAQKHPAKALRERAYIAALSDFYRPGPRDYQSRVESYAAAMGKLYAANPADTDAGAFYALALLASSAPNDDSLNRNHQAMAVLTPLFAKYPDHPGVVHYIIHACDTPSMAKDGLAAAKHYGEIAASAPHAVHMPGHIFSRLGLWQEDIDSNVGSVAASHAAEERKQSGAMDQFHSDDFLVYAYLQAGQESRAKAVLDDSAAAMAHFEKMTGMGEDYMTGMFPYGTAELEIGRGTAGCRGRAAGFADLDVLGARRRCRPPGRWATSARKSCRLRHADDENQERPPCVLRRFDRFAHRARGNARLG